MSITKLSERLSRRNRRKETPPSDSTIGRLRKVRNDKGNAALIGVLIAIAITGIMLTIAGPDMLALIRDTRGAKLNQNFAAAVSVVENRLRSDPNVMVQSPETYDAGSGHLISGGDLHDALFADGGDFEWQTSWDLPPLGSASDTNIYVQFVDDGGDALASATAAPEVPWLTSDGTAVRLQAANEDGKWICALIVNRATVGTQAELNTAATYGTYASATASAVVIPTAISPVRMNARLAQTWYNSGEEYSTVNQTHHCSPVADVDAAATTAAPISPLPADTQTWNIPRDTERTTATSGMTLVTLRQNP
jgi:hypothetical protein